MNQPARAQGDIHIRTYRNAGLWLLATALLLALAVGCSRTKTDAQVASEVQAKIQSDFAVTNKQLSITANNGVVTLAGTVNNAMERAAAANDAAQIEGVRTVVNDLTVSDQNAGMLNQPAPPRPTPGTPRRSSGVKASSGTTAANIPPPLPNDNGAPMASAPMPPPPPPPVEVPAGTSLEVRMLDQIDSDKNQAGDRFRATLDAPIYVDDRIAIPANADVEGRVVDLASAGHFKGKSQLALELTRISYSGHTYTIQTNRWSKEGASRGVRTAETIGGGAALGAIIGGIAGGGKGAAIGAGVGAGAGTGVQAATRGQQIHLPPETVLNFRLQQPITVAAAGRNSSPGQVSERRDNQDYNNDPDHPVLKRR